MSNVSLNSALSIRIGKYNIDITRCPPKAIVKLHQVLIDKYTDIENIHYGPFLQNLHRAADTRMNGVIDIEELRILVLSFTKALWNSAKAMRYWGDLEPALSYTKPATDSSNIKSTYNTRTHVGSDSGILLNSTDGLRLYNSKCRLEDINKRIEKLSAEIVECSTAKDPDACRSKAVKTNFLDLTDN